jgi:hypothetical protein
MPKWKVSLETTLQGPEFGKRFRKNIQGYLEKKLLITLGKRFSVIYQLDGYILRAHVSYHTVSEIHPLLIERPARWKPVYDQTKWRNRAKMMAAETYGKARAEEMFPDTDEEE